MIASQTQTPSNLLIIRTLVAKDWRVARTTIIALVILGAACYALPLAAFWNFGSAQDHRDHLNDTVFDCAVAAISMTGLLAAAFGGAAIAGERADGTAEFVDLLPVSRGQIVLSKWIVSFIALGGAILLHSMVTFAIKYLFARDHTGRQIMPEDAPSYSVMLLGLIAGMFAVGWLCGSFLNSPVIATGISIGVTLGVFIWIQIAVDDGHKIGGLNVQSLTAVVASGIALPSLVAGTVYYLKRVKP